MRINFRIFFLLLLVSTSMLSAAHAFHQLDLNDISEKVKLSFQNKDIESLSAFFDNTIELTINNKHNTYSKDHAIVLLKDYLSRQNIKSYETNYKGGSVNLNSLYIIGTAFTATDSMKVYLFLKYKSSKYLIEELKIGN